MSAVTFALDTRSTLFSLVPPGFLDPLPSTGLPSHLATDRTRYSWLLTHFTSTSAAIRRPLRRRLFLTLSFSLYSLYRLLWVSFVVLFTSSLFSPSWWHRPFTKKQESFDFFSSNGPTLPFFLQRFGAFPLQRFLAPVCPAMQCVPLRPPRFFHPGLELYDRAFFCFLTTSQATPITYTFLCQPRPIIDALPPFALLKL